MCLRPMLDKLLDNVDKPDVDLIEGLSPAISIDQKTTNEILDQQWNCY